MVKKPTSKNAFMTGDARGTCPAKPPGRSENGQAIVEFAIAFPLQLLIMLSIMQLALIYVGKQVVTYSAYKAARSAAVAQELDQDRMQKRAHRSAAMICSPITGPTIQGSNVHPMDINNDSISLPGWGTLPKSGISSSLKTHVSALEYIPPGEIEATVTHYYELTLPIVGFLFGSIVGGGPVEDFEHGLGPDGSSPVGREIEHESQTGIWNVTAPHMRLRSTARVALPGSE